MNDDGLLKNVKTKDEANILLEEIKIVRNGLYESSEGAMEGILRNEVRVKTAESMRAAFTKKDMDKKNYLDQLVEIVRKMPEVSLVLAFEPSEGAIDRFYKKIIQLTGKKVLINIVHNPQIIGGAVIVHEGEYRDFSFKKAFIDEFDKSREKIISESNKLPVNVPKNNT